jgi:hypothetical protein
MDLTKCHLFKQGAEVRKELLKVVGNEKNGGWRVYLNNLYIFRNVVIEVCFQFD